MKLSVIAVVAAGLLTFSCHARAQEMLPGQMPQNIYDFKVKTMKGADKSLGDYKGQVLLIVNTASHCGYTSQYSGLEKLYERYKARGFAVLAFPANDFMNQEPG